MSELRIFSLNTNGLNDIDRRRSIIKNLIDLKADILILVDTRLNPCLERRIRNDFNFNIYSSLTNEPRRGVSILFKRSINYVILDSAKDNEGNILSLKTKINDDIIIITGLYAPNRDSPFFYDNAFDISNSWGVEKVCIGGDFNTTLSWENENFNYRSRGNDRSRTRLNELLSEFNFYDPIRSILGNVPIWTWKRGTNPLNNDIINSSGLLSNESFNSSNQSYRHTHAPRARLDFIFVSESLNLNVTSADVHNRYISDHKAISISVNLNNFKNGKGIWRANDKLLKIPNFCSTISREIKFTLLRHINYPGLSNVEQEAPRELIEELLGRDTDYLINTYGINIPGDALIETVINTLRNESASFEANLRKNVNQELPNLIKKLKSLDNEGKFDTSEYQELNLRYNSIIDSSVNNFFKGRKKMWVEQGEKMTSSFLGLQKTNKCRQSINKIKKVVNNSTSYLTHPKDIGDAIHNFYKNLYENKDDLLNNVTIEDFLRDKGGGNPDLITKLPPDIRCNLDRPIDISELDLALLKAKKDGAPGISGISYRFYEKFWPELRPIVFFAIKHFESTGNISRLHRVGIVSLLPKGDKNKDDLANWRPLTLLCVFYKLISSILTNRIITAVDFLIDPSQTGFIPGRSINENLRCNYDVIDLANKFSKPGIILQIDFKKAFDTISFKYIEKTLRFFNFGDKFIFMVNSILKDFYAVTVNGGHISEQFRVARGCRQGDPLSPLLFILCVEILNIRIRNDQNILPFSILGVSIPSLSYADDINVYLNYCANSLRQSISVLQAFFKISGLEINLNKTCCTYIGGPFIPEIHSLCPELNITWVTSFKLLGIQFDNCNNNRKENYSLKIKDIMNELDAWEFRLISPMGRLVVVKSLGLSKLTNVAATIPSITATEIKNLESSLVSFIWGKNKRPKMALKDAKLPIKRGGLNFPDILSSWQSFKFSWIRKIIDCKNRNAPWFLLLKAYLLSISNRLNIDDISFWSPDDFKFAVKHVKLSFWKEIFSISLKLIEMIGLSNLPRFLNSQPWGHTNFVNNGHITKFHIRVPHNTIINFSDLVNIGARGFLVPKDIPSLATMFPRAPITQLDRVFNATQVICSEHRLANFLLPSVFQTYPTVAWLAHWSKKGCSKWAIFLKSNRLSDSSLIERENIWRNRLGLNLDAGFWSQVYNNTARINFDNWMLLFQSQINRAVLHTNHSASHHVISIISPNCNYCNLVEDNLHALWECERVQRFFSIINNSFSDTWLENKGPIIRSEYIFNTRGHLQPRGLFLLLLKKHIWNCRCNNSTLGIDTFKLFSRNYLEPYLNQNISRNWQFINNLVLKNALI